MKFQEREIIWKIDLLLLLGKIFFFEIFLIIIYLDYVKKMQIH